MKPRSLARLALCAVALTVVGGQAAATAAGGRTVTLRNIAFSPKNLTIARNSTVTFAFRDDGTAHNVVSKGSKKFKSISVRSSGSQSRKFTAAGTYRYVCTLHPGMAGRITVH
jgi:plastocyanin